MFCMYLLDMKFRPSPTGRGRIWYGQNNQKEKCPNSLNFLKDSTLKLKHQEGSILSVSSGLPPTSYIVFFFSFFLNNVDTWQPNLGCWLRLCILFSVPNIRDNFLLLCAKCLLYI